MKGHETQEQLIAAWVLDDRDIDEAERLDLVEHLTTCSNCREVFADARAAVDDLALVAEPLPVSPDLADRVLERARGTAVADTPTPRRRMLTALAAAAMVVLVLGGSLITVGRSLDRERARADRASAAVALLSRPDVERVTLESTGDVGHVSVAVAPDGSAVLLGTDLVIPDDRLLEIWLLRDDSLVPGEVFVPDAGTAVVAFQIDPRRDTAIALTVERERVPVATTDPIFQGALPTT